LFIHVTEVKFETSTRVHGLCLNSVMLMFWSDNYHINYYTVTFPLHNSLLILYSCVFLFIFMMSRICIQKYLSWPAVRKLTNENRKSAFELQQIRHGTVDYRISRNELWNYNNIDDDIIVSFRMAKYNVIKKILIKYATYTPRK